MGKRTRPLLESLERVLQLSSEVVPLTKTPLSVLFLTKMDNFKPMLE